MSRPVSMEGRTRGERGSKLSTCVVIPALDEEATIADVARGALLFSDAVIVVDDGSTDRTAELAQQAGAHVIRHPRNVGQWSALRTGFREALRRGFDIVITMDADGQHDPTDIPRLLEPILEGRADLVIGSRLRGRSVTMIPYRYAGIKFFSKLLSTFMHVNLTDVTSGFRAYCSWLLKALVKLMRERQYGILEATIIAWRLGARIEEKPIKFVPRRTSKKGNIRFFLNLIRVLLRALMAHLRSSSRLKAITYGLVSRSRSSQEG